MKAKIFDIKHFAVHDGNGIRTTVFFKGCPLNCKWCHNPEGLSHKTNLAFFKHLCTNCGDCVSTCKQNVHRIIGNEHTLVRENCTYCGNCVSTCLNNALKIYGKDVTVEDLLPELLQDKDFYLESNGGITLSGGECLLQADFCAKLLEKIRENGINTAVDTCGFIQKESIEKVLPYTDTFLYDLKAFDEDVHIKFTGKSNKIILDNLKYLYGQNKDIEIRIPFIPNVNDSQIEKTSRFLSTLTKNPKVRILPYHDYYFSKYQSLNMINTFKTSIPNENDLATAKNILKSYNCIVLE